MNEKNEADRKRDLSRRNMLLASTYTRGCFGAEHGGKC